MKWVHIKFIILILILNLLDLIFNASFIYCGTCLNDNFSVSESKEELSESQPKLNFQSSYHFLFLYQSFSTIK